MKVYENNMYTQLSWL